MQVNPLWPRAAVFDGIGDNSKEETMVRDTRLARLLWDPKPENRPTPEKVLEEREAEARVRGDQLVVGSSAFAEMRDFKRRMVEAVQESAKEQKKLEASQRDYLPVAFQTRLEAIRAKRADALAQLLEEYQKAEAKLLATFTAAELPAPEIKVEDAARIQTALAQLPHLGARGILDLITEAAVRKDRPLLHTLLPVVRSRRDEAENRQPESFVLYEEALRRIDLSETHPSVAAYREARERAESMRIQLGTVVQTLEERGEWSGPAATMHPRTTPDFPIVGEAEERSHRLAEKVGADG